MNDRIYYSRRAEELVKRQRAVGALVFLAVGLGIGLILALLFAPNVGEKTRKLIADALEDGSKRGQEVILEATNQLEQEFPDLRQRIEGVLNRN
jgi:gas vesicle protein